MKKVKLINKASKLVNKDASEDIITVNKAAKTKSNLKRTGHNAMRVLSAKKVKNTQKKEKPGKHIIKEPDIWPCECGASNITTFCGACGRQVPVEVCKGCSLAGTANTNGTNFCGDCGRKFEETDEG